MTYITQRLIQVLPVLLIASIPLFLILHLAPGDPAALLAGEDATDEEVEFLRNEMGLDQPLVTQYFVWLGKVLTGDFGRAYFANDIKVEELIRQRFPATLELAIAAMVITVLLSFPFGVLAALKRGKTADHLVMGTSTVSIAVPNFWLGILLLLIFSLWLGWLPAGGRPLSFLENPLVNFKFLILPAFTLALYTSATLVRFVRVSMLEVMHQDYIRTAYAKGLSFRTIVFRHALQNALVPSITVMGVQFGRLLAGAIIIEFVFAWPGLGALVLGGIQNRDYQLVQGCILIFLVFVVFSNLMTDLIYGFIDPRISVAG